MKAISLWRPRTALAYLAGVYQGDGFLSDGGATFGLHVKDEDFVRAFADSMTTTFGITPKLHRDGPYWRVRLRRAGMFCGVAKFQPVTDEERGAWLRGFFDSEGHASCGRAKASSGSVNRRVAFYNTDRRLLVRTRRYLAALGIKAVVRATRTHLHPSHYGSRPVWDLRISHSPESFTRFRDEVGSSIARKSEALARIVASYRDPFEYRSLGGRRGCTTRWGGRTHCAYNHELHSVNIYISKTGARCCVECRRRRVRESRARKGN